MYKVFIADDEKWVIESLKASINWKELGFEVVGQALNGIQALKQILQMKPEVVFTDIRMPGLNGLELIQKVKEETDEAIQFIIVSGFAEFAYAQKAMNSGAVGYCLKPFDKNDIVSLLNKVKGKMESGKRAGETSFFDLLESVGKNRQVRVLDLFERVGLRLNVNEELLILESIGDKDLEFSPDVKFLKFKTSIRKTTYIINSSSAEFVKSYFSTRKPDGIQSIGIGTSVKILEDLHIAIENADIAVYHFFITNTSGVYEASLLNKGDISDILREIRLAIHQKDSASITMIFKRADEAFSKGEYNIKHAFRFYNSTMSYLDTLMGEHTEEYIYNFEQLVESFDHMSDALKFLKDQISIHLSGNFDYKTDGIGNKSFISILQYIKDCFYDNITLQSLSQKYFVSASYLCQLFKKEVGMTFTEYISALRINHACELLIHSDFRIHVIGEKVGYHDYFYFCKIFKRITSKSPTQYREEGNHCEI